MTIIGEIDDLDNEEIVKIWREDIPGYDDEPYLFILTKSGKLARITANYGGYTGKSEDEYRRFIEFEIMKPKSDTKGVR